MIPLAKVFRSLNRSVGAVSTGFYPQRTFIRLNKNTVIMDAAAAMSTAAAEVATTKIAVAQMTAGASPLENFKTCSMLAEVSNVYVDLFLYSSAGPSVAMRSPSKTDSVCLRRRPPPKEPSSCSSQKTSTSWVYRRRNLWPLPSS